MKIAVVNIRREPYYRKGSIEHGLKRLGYTVGSYTRPLGKESLLCVWNRKKGAEEQAADRWESMGGTVLVFENGFLQKVDKTYYALGVHGHNGSGHFPVGDEDRFSKLGFSVKPMGASLGSQTVVRAQRGIGSTLMASPPQWAEKLVSKLKRDGRQALLAPHPGDKKKMETDLKFIRQACELHIWSSAMGVRALVEGVPVRHYAPHWICEGWQADREAALRKMAWGQWHFDEIASGEPFARIVETIK